MIGVVYGLSCLCHPEAGVRYIGQTARTSQARLKEHVRDAEHGVQRPIYFWIRKHGVGNIVSTELRATRSALAREFGVSTVSVKFITRGRTWKHLGLEPIDGRTLPANL